MTSLTNEQIQDLAQHETVVNQMTSILDGEAAIEAADRTVTSGNITLLNTVLASALTNINTIMTSLVGS